jgi:predicted DNA-binding transcriptional regulator YafY
MSTNKNALIRYKVLDRCFRNIGKRFFIEDLIEECNKALSASNPKTGGISRRQIFEDISFMESSLGWSVDLEKSRDGKRIYYRYRDTGFSINNMPLNEVEINQLKSAIEILSQFKGMPQFEWVHELVAKLQQGTIQRETKTIIEFDSNQYLAGIENLGELYNAIVYKKVLHILYKPFENDVPIEFIIHPYYLRQYNNRWFLFGYNPERKKYDWNLALDRIISISEFGDKYHKNTAIDWSEYFDDIIGVTKPDGASTESITLQFFGKTGNYIVSKPLHGSQKYKWTSDDILEVKLKVIINYELERVILSYADSVKVIAPKKLYQQIQNRLSAALHK